jgi:hypothetical protein
MKLAQYLLVGTFGVALICLLGLAKAGTTNSQAQPLLLSGLALSATNGSLLLKAPIPTPVFGTVFTEGNKGNEGLFQTSTAEPLSAAAVQSRKGPLPFLWTRSDGQRFALFDLRSKGQEKLKPGIYEAAPYSGIVVVPEAHTDDRALVPVGNEALKMPVIKPEIRLIPRGTEKK